MANTGLNISGIYKIESKVYPERIYIGSAISFIKRWRNHLSDLKKGKHHSKKLQRHYDKYGVNDLTFCVISVCDKKELMPVNNIIWIETCFIGAYRYIKDNKPYFNNCPNAGSNLGTVRSAEARKKNSEAKKGQVGWSKGLTKETHPSIMASAEKRIGQKRTAETRKKQSDAKQGRYDGENHPFFGKHHTEETKTKLREANIGKTLSQETKDKMSKVRKGKKLSEKQKADISKRMMGNKHGLKNKVT